MSKHAAEETYKDVDRLIHSISHMMAGRFSLPVDEVHSEANAIFVRCFHTYNPSESKFSTWLYNMLVWRLTDWCKSEYLSRRHEELPEAIPCHNHHAGWLADFRAGLSDEAKAAVDAILSDGSDLKDMLRLHRAKRKRKVKTLLREHLIELGWLHEEINRGFREITELLTDGLREPKVKEKSKALRQCKLKRGHVYLLTRKNQSQSLP